MFRSLAWLAGTLLLLVLAAGGLFLAAIDRQPLVLRDATVSPQAVAQARHLLLSNDPRRLPAGALRQTAIPTKLLDEAVNYTATRFLNGRGVLALTAGEAYLRLSLSPPWLGGAYLNIDARLQDRDGLPAIASLRLGALPLPAFLAEPLLGALFVAAGRAREWQLIHQAIRSTRFDGERQRVVVAYVWQPDLLDRARALAVAPADQVLIRDAQTRLAALLAQTPGQRTSLASLLGPLLQTDSKGQRAALLVLAAYLAERDLTPLIPEAATWPRLPQRTLTLARRYDSAQHFVIAAALAAWAGEPLAQAIGTYKELADARRGSGFSFADLAADWAGTAFGELVATGSPTLDALLAGEPSDADLLPPLEGLPEYLRQREFRQRYGGPGNPAYDSLLADIKQRITALPLYRRSSPART